MYKIPNFKNKFQHSEVGSHSKRSNHKVINQNRKHILQFVDIAWRPERKNHLQI